MLAISIFLLIIGNRIAQKDKTAKTKTDSEKQFHCKVSLVKMTWSQNSQEKPELAWHIMENFYRYGLENTKFKTFSE